MIPKYAKLEIERRWLVEPGALATIRTEGEKRITDKYLVGTRLRLRRIDDGGGAPVFKLCKKYGPNAPHAEPIVNIYLDESEYRMLERLPGVVLRKRRLYAAGGGLDVFESLHDGLVIFEREFPDEPSALAYAPPEFALREITGETHYSGAALAWAEKSDAGA